MTDRVRFYEELVEDAVDRALRLQKTLEDFFGERPFGYERLGPVERLERLREMLEDDAGLMAFWQGHGTKVLFDALLEEHRLKDRLGGTDARP